MKSKPPVNNQTSGNLVSYEAGPESYQIRNDVIPSPEKMRQELLGVLGYYNESSDVDKSGLEIGQTNSQKDVVNKVAESVLQGDYATAQAILFREDIKITPQMEEIALRLNRLVQVDVRQGTTDTPEFADAKEIIKTHEDELVKFSSRENKQEARLILENVIESVAGTREMGETELSEAREMLQRALKNEIKSNYEQPLPPHQLSGQKEGAHFINRDGNPKLTEYFRLFGALTLEMRRQRKIASAQEKDITVDRNLVATLLDNLSKTPGIEFDENLKNKFVQKIAVMDLNQLAYFEQKIRELKRNLENTNISPESAGAEIRGWMAKDFTPQELSADLQKVKEENDKLRNEQLEVLRGSLNKPILHPIDKPVAPEEYFKK
ncbi:MAG: hypothetical protein HY918_03630 [Candidatus Doudnabacteria bacterium]|nr:hypothetical protein [Candidatus Doudnabacteria bacterium]